MANCVWLALAFAAAMTLTGFVLVPRLGFTGSCLGSPIAWILADAFLIPAYFHVRKKLARINTGNRRRRIYAEQETGHYHKRD